MAQPTDWYALLDEADQKRRKPNKASTNKPASTNNQAEPSTNTSTNRRKRWRENNPDKYRAYQREYMRRKRAEDSNSV